MPKKVRNPHPIAIAKRRANLTYGEIAEHCGFSHGYLRQIASGARKPSFDVAEMIAAELTADLSSRSRLTMAIMRYRYRKVA